MCPAHYGWVCSGWILQSEALSDRGPKSVLHHFSIFNTLLTGCFVGLCGLVFRPELQEQLYNSSGFPGLKIFPLTGPNFSCEPSVQLLKIHRNEDKNLLLHPNTGSQGWNTLKDSAESSKFPCKRKYCFYLKHF